MNAEPADAPIPAIAAQAAIGCAYDYLHPRKQKRIRRPPTVAGMDVDEFIRQNAYPIWISNPAQAIFRRNCSAHKLNTPTPIPASTTMLNQKSARLAPRRTMARCSSM